VTAKRARVALAALVALLAGAALLAFSRSAPSLPSERPESERPELMLLTTLPIVFAERLSLEAPDSPALEALQSRYRVVPISVTAGHELGNRKLLLMAQPQAQPAEALVELDGWVRRGGRALLLADPALEWPSERPLGDKLRPPMAFADTGLLKHWGLGMSVDGTLAAFGNACDLAHKGAIARCRIGRGRATVIADADFLRGDQADGVAGSLTLGTLLRELEGLEQ
jgi:hypothetical protein